MQLNHVTTKAISFFCLLVCYSMAIAQTTKLNPSTPAIDVQKAGKIIDSIDKQFSKDFFNGDSVALANHYAKDGQIGSRKAEGILSYWGQAIRDSMKDNARNLIFTTTALTTDGEFLVELGRYEIKDDQNHVKDKGKYVVVWKQENGEWKLYRDIGL